MIVCKYMLKLFLLVRTCKREKDSNLMQVTVSLNLFSIFLFFPEVAKLKKNFDQFLLHISYQFLISKLPAIHTNLINFQHFFTKCLKLKLRWGSCILWRLLSQLAAQEICVPILSIPFAFVRFDECFD